VALADPYKDLPERLLDEMAVEVMTGMSRFQRSKEEAEGRFPKRVRVGTRTVRWKQSEVLQWIKNLPTGPSVRTHDRSPFLTENREAAKAEAEAAAGHSDLDSRGSRVGGDHPSPISARAKSRRLVRKTRSSSQATPAE
jgi:prophage regulatory protein